MKVSELSGALLDFWVAKHAPACTDLSIEWRGDHWIGTGDIDGSSEVVVVGSGAGIRGTMRMRRLYGRDIFDYQPSFNWSDGGPLLEQERIDLEYLHDEPEDRKYTAFHHDLSKPWKGHKDMYHEDGRGQGPTPLIAAMRAFVASKIGEEVTDAPSA